MLCFSTSGTEVAAQETLSSQLGWCQQPMLVPKQRPPGTRLRGEASESLQVALFQFEGKGSKENINK